MSLLGFLTLLLIAAVCGSLGQSLAGYSLGGCLTSMVVGFVGAWFGLWLARSLSLPPIMTITIDGETFPLVWAIIGSAILALLAGLLTRPRALV